MYVPKKDKEWLLQHAEQVEDGRWKCKKTGEYVDFTVTGRSIWIRPFMGGSGEVRQVGHLNCPGCQPDFKAPEYGTPIYEDELVGASR